MTGEKSEPERRPADSLRATAIFRSFEGVAALRDVTVSLAPREVLGLIGPNGAGKTTLVNIITGFDSPDGGAVTLGAVDITGWTPNRRGRNGLARTFQGAHSFSRLSVQENVEVSALGSGASTTEARRRAARLLEALALAGLEEVPAGVLPHGHERKLGVARALATAPRFVLMDEPAAGLNEAEVDDFAALIRDVRDEYEAGLLLIDHNITLIMEVCDRVHVLDQGQTIAQGTPDEIRHNADVAAAYLGTTVAGAGNGDG